MKGTNGVELLHALEVRLRHRPHFAALGAAEVDDPVRTYHTVDDAGLTTRAGRRLRPQRPTPFGIV
jgi:hypothetical protein